MNIKHYILKDREIVEVDLMPFRLWFKDRKNRRVDETFVGEYRVSTVFLGFDHSYGELGPPILFETMVFNKNKDDLECERYCTYTEAEHGHEVMVEKVKAR